MGHRFLNEIHPAAPGLDARVYHGALFHLGDARGQYVKNKGIVLNEPSVVAMDKNTGKLLKVGEEARQMLGRPYPRPPGCCACGAYT